MGRRHTPESFWNRVNVTNDPDECWLWTGSQTRDPYGKPSYGSLSYQSQFYVAHRLAWILTNGDPGDLYVLHRCDNPPCCNPSHLFLGTLSDNMQDRKNKGRHTRYPNRDPSTGQWLSGGQCGACGATDPTDKSTCIDRCAWRWRRT